MVFSHKKVVSAKFMIDKCLFPSLDWGSIIEEVVYGGCWSKVEKNKTKQKKQVKILNNAHKQGTELDRSLT